MLRGFYEAEDQRPCAAMARNRRIMATTPDIPGGLDCEESRIPQLKPIEESLQKLVHKAFATGGEGDQAVKNFLNGTWLGEPLHVVLTYIPIGAWMVALVCDGHDLMSNRREFGSAANCRSSNLSL